MQSALLQRFSSELVCACLHELMTDLSTRMPIPEEESFDIAKFQDFLREQNSKDCGHSDYVTMELEMGSLIVLACKRIKDLQYLVENQNERLLVADNEYQLIVNQYSEKAIQLEQM
jgi:hypothetical protein